MNRFLMNRFRIILFILFAALVFQNTGYAQSQETEPIQKSDWQKLKDDYHYKKAETKKKSKKDKGKQPSGLNISGEYSGDLKIISYILVFLIIGTILYFILRYLSSLESGKAPDGLNSFKFYTDPDDLENQDLEALLKTSLMEGNFNHALRIRFLMLLRELNRNKLITWKRDKTNRYYRLQLRDQRIYPDFKNYCNLYEPTHYGNLVIEEKGFQYAETLYNQMIQTIKIKEA